LLLFLPTEVAVPLSVMLSISIALVIIIQDHAKIHFNSAKWLIIYALLGIPLGVLILIYGNETFVKTALGILIILYALFSLLHKSKATLKKDNNLWLFICGFTSGI